jgi:hypothetical protein
LSLQCRQIGGRNGGITRFQTKKAGTHKKEARLQQLTMILAKLESFYLMDQVLVETVNL